MPRASPQCRASCARILQRAARGDRARRAEIGSAVQRDAASELTRGAARRGPSAREPASARRSRIVINRNINYTNICLYHCGFCAFSKGRSAARRCVGRPTAWIAEEIARRTLEARPAGATEVCLQGGIHPRYTGQTYLDIVATVKSAVPDMHVHAFSPLEITHGARTLGLSLRDYLDAPEARRDSRRLPGTAAEILDDEVRALICPDKISTAASGSR